jgi:methylated-DNA-[protein]-cysteine S-methyltransferase
VSDLFYYASPLGTLEISAGSGGLEKVCFIDEVNHTTSPENGLLKKVKQQLDEYFAGKRQSFDLKLDPRGSEFQLKVWGALREIPYGKTISYLDLARKSGDPKLTRAVGAANGSNPIAIIIPCHRVIGSRDELTGYVGGIPRKQYLLHLEQGCRQQELFPVFDGS